MNGNGQTLLICCGATAREITVPIDGNGLDYMKVEGSPASMHKRPKFIPERAHKKIRANQDGFERILVLYSDCRTGGQLQNVLDAEGVQGLNGTHCYEMYAGATAFAAITEDEVCCFFLTDYLTQHFERLVIQGLSLDRHPELRDSYFANYQKVVSLAQRDEPALRDLAASAAGRLGLDLEIRQTGYGNYRDFISHHARTS